MANPPNLPEIAPPRGHLLHLCCTPFQTWCHQNTGSLITTKSIVTFMGEPNACPRCKKLFDQWFNPVATEFALLDALDLIDQAIDAVGPTSLRNELRQDWEPLRAALKP